MIIKVSVPVLSIIRVNILLEEEAQLVKEDQEHQLLGWEREAFLLHQQVKAE